MRCARCEKQKPPEAFYAGQKSWCKDCAKEYRRARYAAMTPREKRDAAYAAKLKRSGAVKEP